MRPIRITFTALFLLILCQISLPAFCQLGIPITISKPKEYDERVLRSEKSDEKKFTLPKRFFQNMTTHYNYYFNANNKLNEVLEKAKLAHKDDYAELLSFYNYSLDVTVGDSIQLDSITYKASSGIALHDLRNDWVDNLYLLWGAAFYLQKKYDSAYLMFQFINYAFAPKEKDGYYRTIGSGRDGNSAYSIASKEKNSIPRKIFSEPPSRNDAFIWQIRNFLAQDQFAEASSLIVALRNDPAFPKRLYNDLNEVQAFWFYKQNIWDSAAQYLSNALSNATNLQEKARWEYLAAQLYEMSDQFSEAEKLYGKVSSHTTDPILDIYARLSTIRVNRDGGEQTIEKNVAKLVKMAKQSKYEDYRDIIYYMAAQMQLEGENIEGAIALLLKSTKYSNNGEEQRNKAFLQLANLSLIRKEYRIAYNFYDSIRLEDPTLKNPEEIRDRKKSLGIIASNIEIIERQDSLQRIALMPEDERKDFVKKLARQLRKQQGLKDEPLTSGSPFTTPFIPSLFPTSSKGEWYFYNATSLSRGKADFKNRWGTRANTDNWRRSAAVGNVIPTNVSGTNQGTDQQRGNQTNATEELSFDGLYEKLPLTPELLKISNDSISDAILALGKAYIQNIEDCNAGTSTLEELRIRFPDYIRMDEVMFNLYYCYNKNGEVAKAEALKKKIATSFGDSDFNTILTTGINPNSSLPNPDATKTYESIYDLFIEGNFTEAEAQKKKADSIYNKNFWNPQLLYIEAVYYIKERKDSVAKKILATLISQFDNSPLVPKATTLLNVLNRREEIENELRNMVVTRIPGDSATGKLPVTRITQPKRDTTKTVQPVQPIVTTNIPRTDTIAAKPVTVVNSSYVNAPAEPHYVVLLLNKVDPVFSNEAKNAFARYNRFNFAGKNYSIELFELDASYRLLLIAPFIDAQDAISYIDKAIPKTATEIIPWLKGGKYTFSILTNGNLELLKVNKDVDVYKSFLNQHFPGKFQ